VRGLTDCEELVIDLSIAQHTFVFVSYYGFVNALFVGISWTVLFQVADHVGTFQKIFKGREAQFMGLLFRVITDILPKLTGF
jgi:hypothetical protein